MLCWSNRRRLGFSPEGYGARLRSCYKNQAHESDNGASSLTDRCRCLLISLALAMVFPTGTCHTPRRRHARYARKVPGGHIQRLLSAGFRSLRERGAFDTEKEDWRKIGSRRLLRRLTSYLLLLGLATPKSHCLIAAAAGRSDGHGLETKCDKAFPSEHKRWHQTTPNHG